MDITALMQGMKPVQDAMARTEVERSQAVITGTAGGGAVRLAITGLLDVRSLTIAPAAAASAAADPSLLEDLVATALRDALRQYRARFGVTADEQMRGMLGGADLGALMGALTGKR
jgi:nucleoid-associated protein EbfC